MKRITLPALGLISLVDDGWSQLEHKIWPSKGLFCWKEAPLYLEYDKGFSTGKHRSKYEKIIFEAFSFVEHIMSGMPSISIIEEQIKERKEISEKEYQNIGKKLNFK